MLEQLIAPISGLLGKFIEDKDQKNALAHEIATLISPILAIWLVMPAIDSDLLMPTMTGMLGLGAMRSYEKVKGVSREK